MKGIFALVLLAASTQAIDFSKLKVKTLIPPAIRPSYTGAYWDFIKSNQENKLVQYPGYKRGSKPQPASAGYAPSLHNSRVVGGEVAKYGQFPWQAWIIMDNTFVCGGSLISEEWILTAGQCAYGFKSFAITLGAQHSDGTPDQYKVTLTSTDAQVHINYDPATNDHDIAVIKLPYKIQLNEYIHMIWLPPFSMNNNDLDDKVVSVSGWGKDSDNAGGISPVLRFTSMPVMLNTECAKTYGDVIDFNKICTDTIRGHSFCGGDVGGPLEFKRGYDPTLQVGIASFGISAGCEKGNPAVFTRVTSYLQWIESITGIPINP